jgi:hypothetical protein
MLALLLSLLFFEPSAEAKPKRSGASRSASGASSEFAACVETAVAGSKSSQCQNRRDAVPCVGLKRALEFSREKTKCFRPRGEVCEEWGHGEHAQSEWVSIAAAHLAKFGGCLKAQYGSEESSGLAEAQADEGLIALLKKIDDGSRAYRLELGTVLVQALQGDRFGRILERSPLAREISPHDFFTLKDAADTPAVLEQELRADEDGGGASGGEGNIAAIFADFSPDYLPPLPTDRKKSPGPAVVGKFSEPADQRSPASVAAKPAPLRPRVVNNPYSLGLDRTLFERITATYLRHSPALKGTDDFIRTQNPAPAKDLGELLSRGGTL